MIYLLSCLNVYSPYDGWFTTVKTIRKAFGHFWKSGPLIFWGSSVTAKEFYRTVGS
jgi:hypothetical protein